MAVAQPGLIGYVTDLEGDVACWRRYIDISKVLDYGCDGDIELAADAHFVFGGDAVDNQPGDLEILEQLLKLKRRYPERVHLIMGNRDVNKLRLLVELSPAHLAAVPLASHPGVYWLPKESCTPAQKLSEEDVEANSASARLQWILRETMGAPRAFEFRRQELGVRFGGGVFSDDDVVRSYVESVQPGGLIYEYLQAAKLAVKLGDTLFVHAGLPRGDSWAPGWIPGPPPRQNLPLDEWLTELNAFAASAMDEVADATQAGRECLEAWSCVGGYSHAQAGCGLMQYCMRDMPDGSRQPSIVYNGWLGDDYQPVQPDDATLSWLRDGGVHRVVSGHLPNGESPLVLRPSEHLDVITADCCYAGSVSPAVAGEVAEPKPWSGRGGSVCEVVLEPDRKTYVHGRLSEGLHFEAPLEDTVIGRTTSDGWRVKGRVGGKILLSRNDKWSFESVLKDECDVHLEGILPGQ